MNVRDLILVAAGGAMGALARFGASTLSVDLLGTRFPWGTLVVNVLGCFAMGALIQAGTTFDMISPAWKLAFGTGFLGAFTTFSTFGIETVHAWHRSPTIAALNVTGNMTMGLAAVVLGTYLAARVFGPLGS